MIKVFILFIGLLLFVLPEPKAQELNPYKVVDPLTGISVELPQGWSYKNTEYGLVFNDMKSFVVIKGYAKRDEQSLVKNLLKEMSYFSAGNPEHAYKRLKSGFVIYSEPLSYPYIYLDPNAQMFLYKLRLPQRYRGVHVIFPSGKVSLIVSIYLPEGYKADKEDIVKLLSSLEFLGAEKRLGYSYARILEPENGMTAALIPVPRGYNFKGQVIEQGTKRWFFYNVSKGDNIFRVDLIDINTQAVGGNFHSLLIVNGLSSAQPRPLCITSQESLGMFLSSFWRAETGKEWKIVEMKDIPITEIEKAMLQDAPAFPGAQPVIFRGLVVAESDGLKRISVVSLNGVISYNPGVVASQSCFQNLTVRLAQFPRSGNEEMSFGILAGININLRINPEWSLYAMRRFTEENRRINQMVREMTRQSQEFNSWMSKTWANLLSDQTYVKDPSTGEVFRLYKRSWETGEFWREPVFGDLILGGVREGSKLQELLSNEGWKRLEESLGGFPQR